MTGAIGVPGPPGAQGEKVRPDTPFGIKPPVSLQFCVSKLLHLDFLFKLGFLVQHVFVH